MLMPAPHAVCAAAPAGAAKTLSACARLANALEVPQLLEELDACMEETGGHQQGS